MKISKLAFGLALSFVCATTPSSAKTWLKSGGVAKTPIGHHQYCKRGGRHCGAQAVRPPAKMSKSRWSKVRGINASVNRRIKPASDMSTRGVKEYWEIPSKKGDCEDYALLKRSKLMSAGFKSSQLPLVKSRLPNGEAHIILLLRTTEGDFVLNNLNNKILPITRTGLRFLTMQSSSNASAWVRIIGKSGKPQH